MAGRSYGQYCGLARALDVMGGRWSLLIVRELLVGPARYGELLAGLPGIATNLLAERLRELEEAGVIRRQLDTDSNAVAYALTPWGSELRATIDSLVSWSSPLMVSGPRDDDSFRTHWLAVALESLMRDRRTKVPATVGVEVDGTLVTVGVDETGLSITLAGDVRPKTVLRADPAIVLGLAAGMLTVDQAVAAGELHGTKKALNAVFARG
jgi:DNA-binding HxlR family transcriptional regulator